MIFFSSCYQEKPAGVSPTGTGPVIPVMVVMFSWVCNSERRR